MTPSSPNDGIFFPSELARFVVNESTSMPSCRSETHSAAAIANRLVERAGDRLSNADCAILADILSGLDRSPDLLLLELAQQVILGQVAPREVAGALSEHAVRMDGQPYPWHLDRIMDQEGDPLARNPADAREQARREFWQWASPLVRERCASLLHQEGIAVPAFPSSSSDPQLSP